MTWGLVWKGVARGCGGLWAFLIAWTRGKSAVELERERNAGTARAIQLLPPGAELREGDPRGWHRVIRMPETPLVTPAVARGADEPRAVGELLS
jgi:hypothetical protein